VPPTVVAAELIGLYPTR